MALEKYQAKRKFDQTPEPKGKKASAKGPLRFVVQKHAASRLHYDFRLEVDGVLKSWAVPKGPSLNPHDKRLAMMVEDHPLEYRNFEGIIPKGNYGGGTVMIWDEGTYHSWETRDPKDSEKILKQGLHKGHLTFIMDGHKLKGEFALIKIRNSDDENAWLLVKADKDQWAGEVDVTELDKSVISGRGLEEIAEASSEEGQVWVSNRSQEQLDLSEAPKKPMPKNIKPMLATLVDQPFDGPGWWFEVKWDGYRVIAGVDRGKVELYSRNQQSFNEMFKLLLPELQQNFQQVVLDGEVVIVDDQGKSSFQLLQNYQRTGEGNLVYYVFDIIYLNGHDLTGLPLKRRKEILRQVLPNLQNIKLSDHIEGKGKDFFAIAQKQGLEGVIAKDSDSTYDLGRRSRQWLKIKTELRQEAVIGGFTEPRGSRKDIGALVLGVYDQNGNLKYIGHTGGGFNDAGLRDMRTKLDKLVRKNSPFAGEPPKTNAPVTWVKPELVVEVKFREWTGDGHMRQPIFIGLRQDKPAGSVRKEYAMAKEEAVKPTETTLSIGGRRLKLTNLDKVFWPDEGYTKGDLINYYRQVASSILPYLKDRPESMNRFPNGINGQHFYQKDIEYAPDWAKTVKIHSEGEERDINYLLCQEEATLIYMINLGCIELNPWFSRTKSLDKPDFLVIDLDPEDIEFEAVVETAAAVKEVCDQAGVNSYCKTSGATGLHVCVPLGAKYDYDQAKQFALIVGTLVNQKLPKITSLERSPAKRQQQVYLDYLQNRRGQTIASAYSVRPKPGATVSAPLDWKEVKKGLSPGQFTIKNMAKRLDKVGDLWKPVLGKGVDLGKALKRLS